MNGALLVIAGTTLYILGYYTSMSYWYERAEKGSLIEIRGEIYKLEKQIVVEKIDEDI